MRAPCRRVVDAIADGAVRATTTVEVIQEFTHVRARRHGRADAGRLAVSLVELLVPLLSIGEQTLRRGLAVYAESDRLGAFDAVLAAASLEVGADALVSADAAFADVAGLRHVVPTDDEVGGLLPGRS